MTAYDPVTMRDLLRIHRERAGMSLGQVATLAGISKTHLWELERGRTCNPTLETLTAIAEAVDVAPVLLFSAWVAERRRALPADGEDHG